MTLRTRFCSSPARLQASVKNWQPSGNGIRLSMLEIVDENCVRHGCCRLFAGQLGGAAA